MDFIRSLPVDMAAQGWSAVNARACARVAAADYGPVPDIEGDACHVFITITDGIIWVSFRGTASLRDGLADVQILHVETGRGGVARGFWRGWQSVVARLTAALEAADVGHAERPIFVTGHSLGGAHAALCAAHLASHPAWDGRVTCYTFGQPFTGCPRWAAYVDQVLRNRYFRVVNDLDIVPRSPLPLWPRKRHAGVLAFLPDFGGIRIKPGLMEIAASDLCGIWNAWRHRDLMVEVGDHHMGKYLLRLGVEGGTTV